MSVLLHPWPWYVAGPLIGLLVPALLLLGNRPFGVSGGLRTLCAALLPARAEFHRFDWRRAASWQFAFLGGTALGGWIAARLLGPTPPAISAATRTAVAALGVPSGAAFAPAEIFSWAGLLTGRGLVCMVGGGFLVGLGTAYAGGCTSGHGVTGLAALQRPSLVAVAGFFAGGLAGTFLLLPLIVRSGL